MFHGFRNLSVFGLAFHLLLDAHFDLNFSVSNGDCFFNLFAIGVVKGSVFCIVFHFTILLGNQSKFDFGESDNQLGFAIVFFRRDAPAVDGFLGEVRVAEFVCRA